MMHRIVKVKSVKASSGSSLCSSFNQGTLPIDKTAADGALMLLHLLFSMLALCISQVSPILSSYLFPPPKTFDWSHHSSWKPFWLELLKSQWEPRIPIYYIQPPMQMDRLYFLFQMMTNVWTACVCCVTPPSPTTDLIPSVIPFRQPAGDIPPSHAALGEAHLCDLHWEDDRGELYCLHLSTVRVSRLGLRLPAQTQWAAVTLGWSPLPFRS